MIIYADILVALNVLVDYFLLRSCGAIRRIPMRRGRMVAAGLLGGAASLFIFLPANTALLCLLGLTSGGIMCVIAFGFHDVRTFLRNMLCLLGISFTYSGMMYALWFFAAPTGMYWHNGVVYFDVSPVGFVLLTLSAYAILTFAQRIGDWRRGQEGAIIWLEMSDRDGTIAGRALVDSGNLLKEPISGHPVIVADLDTVAAIQPVFRMSTEAPEEQGGAALAQAHFRLVRFHTMNGGGWMTACRVQRVVSPDVILHPADTLYIAACTALKKRTGYDFIVPGSAIKSNTVHLTGKNERGNRSEQKNSGVDTAVDGVAGPGAGSCNVYQWRRRAADAVNRRGRGGGNAKNHRRG